MNDYIIHELKMKESKKSLSEITIEPVELLNSSSTAVLRFYKELALSVSNVLYIYIYIVPNVS